MTFTGLSGTSREVVTAATSAASPVYTVRCDLDVSAGGHFDNQLLAL